jgi:hypothetical protein
MGSIKVSKPVKSATIRAVITRADGSKEDLGAVAYWHKNPIKRLWFKLKEIIRGLARNKRR